MHFCPQSNLLQWIVIFVMPLIVFSSGIVEEDMVLSLQQTMPEKTVEKVVEEEEKEELQVKKEDNSVTDMMKLFKKNQLTCSADSPKSLYEKLKDKPEALTVLAPAAGDTIISLDFNTSG